MKLKHWPILIASGLLWGGMVAVLCLLPAGAIYGSAHGASVGLIVLGVILGVVVLVRWARCSIEVADDHVKVLGFFGRQTYAFGDVREVQAALPGSDSSRAFRSPFVLVYPYLGLTSGRRVRLTPGGSFCWNPFLKDVDVSATSANEVAAALRSRLPRNLMDL